MKKETDFSFDGYQTQNDKINAFLSLSPKQRLDWLMEAQKFLRKIPKKNQEMRQRLRNK